MKKNETLSVVIGNVLSLLLAVVLGGSVGWFGGCFALGLLKKGEPAQPAGVLLSAAAEESATVEESAGEEGEAPLPQNTVLPAAAAPAATAQPTSVPTAAPAVASNAETTPAPTAAPTAEPTPAPTAVPTAVPTAAPTPTPESAYFSEGVGPACLGILNGYRAEVGAPALAWDDGLYAVAAARCMEVVTDMSHNGQRTTAECIAATSRMPSAEDAAGMWRGSAGHYELITIPAYARAAVACYRCNGRTYYVYVAEG